MQDKLLPQSVGSDLLSPSQLSPQQEDLCRRMDDLYTKYPLRVRPSNLLRGAVFAARVECRNNPDWVSQAANSLREILYPFWSSHVDAVTNKKAEAFKKYGSVLVDNQFIQDVGRLYGLLNDLAHHGNTSTQVDFESFTSKEFDKLLADFERVMNEALTRQIDIHQEMDLILAGGPKVIEEPANTK